MIEAMSFTPALHHSIIPKEASNNPVKLILESL